MSGARAATLTREELLHLARLASLPLSEGEVSALEGELGRVVAHVEQVLAASADVGLVHAGPAKPGGAGTLAALREDVVVPGLSHDDALAAAPETADGGFSVPTFVSG